MKPVDLTDLEWRRLSEAGSSGGSLYKAMHIVDGVAYYYKMPLVIGKKVVGHEAVNEVIVSRLLDILGIPHTTYELQAANVRIKGNLLTTYVCVSKDFKHPNEASIPLELHCILKGVQEAPHNYLVNMGFQSYVDQMLIVDFLIVNHDRHGYNVELLRSDSGYRLAPLFDNGMCFVSPIAGNTGLINAFDVMSDVDANNYIGTESLYSNLNLVSAPVEVSPLAERDKKRIFHDLSLAIPRDCLTKIWEIIWKRYSYLKEQGYIVEVGASCTSVFSVEGEL